MEEKNWVVKGMVFVSKNVRGSKDESISSFSHFGDNKTLKAGSLEVLVTLKLNVIRKHIY